MIQPFNARSLIAQSMLGLIALLILIPIMVVLASWLEPKTEHWQHLQTFVLPAVLKNTGILLALVTLLTGILGTYLAWLTSMYHFTGQRFFAWALMLPFAIPAYVLAFVSVGLLDFSGIMQTTLRGMGIDLRFLSIRNVWGAGVILSLVFYPYVYLLARQAFLTQGKRALEAGQMLGLSKRMAFFKVALPQALPWIVSGMLLTWMETLADFGAVSVFNVDTFTTAIYKSWFGLFSFTTAVQLASLLIVAVFAVLLLAQYWQKKRINTPSHGRQQRQTLTGFANLGAFLLCLSVFLLAFGFPMMQLLYWVWHHYEQDLNARYWGFVTNTLLIALLASLTITTLAVLMSWLRRRYASKVSDVFISLSNLGYSVPGAVLAVGVFVPIAWLDNRLIAWGVSSTQLLSGSVLIMLLALVVRFLTVGFQPVDRQLQRLTPSQEQAAHLLSDSRLYRWRKVFLPVLQSGVLTALLMVFVDVMKEMPITLMTRRHGWDTLAVRIFEMTSEGMYERAALPSLFIVLASLLPVIILIYKSDRG